MTTELPDPNTPPATDATTHQHGLENGFALVRSGTPHDMAEFFVLRKYRRGGIGRAAARAVFARFPGAWQTRQQWENTGAIDFWRTAIPVPFDEGETDEGPVQRFVIPAGPAG